jgi:hypothetical protein
MAARRGEVELHRKARRLGVLLRLREWADHLPGPGKDECEAERAFLMLRVARWFRETGLAAEVAEAG